MGSGDGLSTSLVPMRPTAGPDDESESVVEGSGDTTSHATAAITGSGSEPTFKTSSPINPTSKVTVVQATSPGPSNPDDEDGDATDDITMASSGTIEPGIALVLRVL